MSHFDCWTDHTKLKSDIENASNKELLDMLFLLYFRQTADEKLHSVTNVKNYMGFNAFDARKMSRIANRILDLKRISNDDIAYLRSGLPKYHSQIFQEVEI